MRTPGILACALLVVWACDESPVTSEPAVIASLTISPDSAVVDVGKTRQLTAIVQDSAGNELTGRLVRWSSSDTALVKVDSTGLVTGIAAGPAVITARSGRAVDSAPVFVLGSVASVKVTPRSATVLVGETRPLTATVRDELGNELANRDIVWTSSDTSVAQVDSAGLVTGIAEGGATIAAAVGVHADSAAIRVFPALTFAALSAGGKHACGLMTDGAAFCWGSNSSRQLGNDTSVVSDEPRRVSGGLEFVALNTFGDHTCAIATDRSAYCWGSNSSGQLGDGTTGADRAQPGLVAGGLSFVTLSAGGMHSCGVTAAGSAYCWGGNEHGQLGDGSILDRSTPVPVGGGLSFASVSAGGGHTCGLTAGGVAYCWGRNDVGQLGDGTTSVRTMPVPVAGSLTFVSLSAGTDHTCGLTPLGAAYCWGANAAGALGDGTTEDRIAPVAVGGGLSFASIDAGTGHTCGVATDGVAYCWGDNAGGQLGDGSLITRTTPSPVWGDLTFGRISAGRLFSCGISTEPLAYCWGRGGLGQIGDGTTDDRNIPTRVFGQPSS